MSPLENLLQHLPDAKPSGKGWSARCPAHDDRHASLSIAEGDDGKVLLKCHTGCNLGAILAAVGLEERDLFPPKDGARQAKNGKPKPSQPAFASAEEAAAVLERQFGKRAAAWPYYDPTGNLVGMVIRWDRQNGGKDIRPIARHADGWRIGAMPAPRPLYRLPELGSAPRVVVCEGEKAADAAWSLGFIATTSAGGSQAANQTDWSPLAGKEVLILPDNDAPGRKYADTVSAILAKLSPAPAVRVVELPGLPESGDIVEWIDAHGDAAEPAALRAEIEALAQQAEPCSATDAEDLACRPFPVHALPEPIRGFVDAGSRAIGCDASYLALPLLTAIAAAIGNTRRLALKRRWSAPPILWAAVVGESGTAKTPAFMLVMRATRKRQEKALKRHAEEMEQYKAKLAYWEKEMSAWKRDKKSHDPPKEPAQPHAERFIVSDTTIEALAPILLANPRGVLLARDELAGWFGSFDRYAGKGKTGADSATWLSMFNAESIVVDRKTGLPKTIYVPQAAVCVVGGIQPGILKRALSQENRESGLAARLLLSYPPRIPKSWTEDDIDPTAEAKLDGLFDRLFELKPTTGEDGEPWPVLVHPTSEAKSAWIAYYNAHGVEQTDLSGDMAAAWSKLEEYAARLALVIHYVRWAAGEVADETRLDVTSMNTGITLANWFKHEARRVYAMLSESDADSAQRRLLDWVRDQGGTVTVPQVQRGCRWLKKSGLAEEALEKLVKAGHGSWQVTPPTAKGGRPGRAFVLRRTPSSANETPAKPDESGGSVDVDSVDAPNREASASGLFGDPPSNGPYANRF